MQPLNPPETIKRMIAETKALHLNAVNCCKKSILIIEEAQRSLETENRYKEEYAKKIEALELCLASFEK